MKRAILVVMSFGLFLGSYAFAVAVEDRWVFFGKSSAGSCFYDKDTVSRVWQDVVKVWDKLIYSEKGKAGFIKTIKDTPEYSGNEQKYARLSEKRTLWEINCKTKESYQLFINLYDNSETVIASTPILSKTRMPITPGSSLEVLSKAVCPNAKKR